MKRIAAMALLAAIAGTPAQAQESHLICTGLQEGNGWQMELDSFMRAGPMVSAKLGGPRTQSYTLEGKQVPGGDVAGKLYEVETPEKLAGSLQISTEISGLPSCSRGSCAAPPAVTRASLKFNGLDIKFICR